MRRLNILVAAAIGICVLVAAPAALAMTWAGPETSPTTSTLYGVACPDANNCWAVGGSSSAGKIIHTSNASSSSPTWITQTPPSNGVTQYNDVDCLNDNDCWAVGNASHSAPLIAATTNGGSTWTAQSPPASVTGALQGVSCASASHCVAVGATAGGSPTIIATANGGSTWTSQTPPSGTNTPLNDVSCPSASVCFAVGGTSSASTVIATANSGSSWAAQTLPSTDNVALNGVTCVSASACFAVGNAISGTGEIVATTNGGTNWSYQSDGTSQTLYDVSCWDGSDCVTVGASGRIAWTTNGTGWSWLNSPTSNTLYSVDVSNQTTGAAVGASGTILGYGSGGTGCNSGGLSFTPPASISWPSTALTGRDQSITTPLSLSPNDETGSGAGWNLTATSTTFTSGTYTLPTSAASITAASATAGTGNCSLPSNQIAYPVTVPAGTTAPMGAKVFDAAAGTGSGPVNVSLTAALNVPGNARTGTYTSTWTLTLASGP
ncbi:MAG TPA: hypothetical protein VMA96_15215 [Solirubrobacteraceae bacterium]|nr:hypothetical protein [Solirubrobacteraceae bacterium]